MAELIVTGRYAIGEGVWQVTTAPGVSTEAMPENWRSGYQATWQDVPAADEYEIWGKMFGPEDAEEYFTERGASVTVDGVRYQRGFPVRPAVSLWDAEPEGWLE